MRYDRLIALPILMVLLVLVSQHTLAMLGTAEIYGPASSLLKVGYSHHPV